MKPFPLPLFVLLAACNAAPPPQGQGQGEAASPSASTPTPEVVPVRRYATQLTAPSPRYTKAAPVFPDPRLMTRAASARAPADAKAVGDLWIQRLTAKGVLGSYGLSGKRDSDPVSSISALMTMADFDAWVAQNGWIAPRHIRWDFTAPLSHPAADPKALAQVRIFPAASRRTGAQNQALLGGRIYVEDGCFYVERGADWGYAPAGRYLVIFGQETGLSVDEEGYLGLYDRYSGQRTARLGEAMLWAGPNGVPGESDPTVMALRAACGTAPLEFVGNVNGAEKFYTELPHTRPRT